MTSESDNAYFVPKFYVIANFLRIFAHENNINYFFTMKFFKEVWGFIWEFDSMEDYFEFTLGRIMAWVIIIGLLYYFIFV